MPASEPPAEPCRHARCRIARALGLPRLVVWLTRRHADRVADRASRSVPDPRPLPPPDRRWEHVFVLPVHGVAETAAELDELTRRVYGVLVRHGLLAARLGDVALARPLPEQMHVVPVRTVWDAPRDGHDPVLSFERCERREDATEWHVRGVWLKAPESVRGQGRRARARRTSPVTPAAPAAVMT